MAMVDDNEYYGVSPSPGYIFPDFITSEQLNELEGALENPDNTKLSISYEREFRVRDPKSYKSTFIRCDFIEDDLIIQLLKKSTYIESLTITGRTFSLIKFNEIIETIMRCTNIQHLCLEQSGCYGDKIDATKILGKLINNEHKPLLSLTIKGRSTGYMCYYTTLSYVSFNFGILADCIMSGSSVHTLQLNSISLHWKKGVKELINSEDTQLKNVNITLAEIQDKVFNVSEKRKHAERTIILKK